MYITQVIPKLSSLQGKTKGKMLVVRSHNVRQKHNAVTNVLYSNIQVQVNHHLPGTCRVKRDNIRSDNGQYIESFYNYMKIKTHFDHPAFYKCNSCRFCRFLQA